MLQHLIAVDLDGTALNSQSQLSQHTIQTLRRLSQEGHLVSIVTGRPYRIAEHLYDQLGINHMPMINFNGALTHIPHHHWAGEHAFTLDEELAFDLLDHYRELGINTMTVESKYKVWANKTSSKIPEFLPDHLTEKQLLTRDNVDASPISLSIQFNAHKVENLKQKIKKSYGQDVETSVWGGSYDVLELLKKGIHKESALSYLAQYYHIDQKNIIAFGDQNNDQEMLDYAGRGVAMKNALPSLKATADDITELDNDHDGMADYLEHYFHLN